MGNASLGDYAMNYYQAMRILDRLKEGWDYPAYVIDQALRMTGDLG